jgi:hypothetical protein
MTREPDAEPENAGGLLWPTLADWLALSNWPRRGPLEARPLEARRNDRPAWTVLTGYIGWDIRTL